MVITRGSVCWADFGPPHGSRPAKTRPVLVVQDDDFNISRLGTVIVAVVTSNTVRASVRGNVFIAAPVAGLSKDSVVDVSALQAVNKSDLDEPIGHLPDHLMAEVSAGLRLVLGLGA